MNVTVKTEFVDDYEVPVVSPAVVPNATIKDEADDEYEIEIDFEAVVLHQNIKTEPTSEAILKAADDEYVFENPSKNQDYKEEAEHMIHITAETCFKRKTSETVNKIVVKNKSTPKEEMRFTAEPKTTERPEEREKRVESIKLIKTGDKLEQMIECREADAEGNRIATGKKREIQQALNLERVKRFKARETAEQCKKRLSSDAKSKRKRVARETVEERQKRLSSESENHRQLRPRETPQQREKRCVYHAEREKKSKGTPKPSLGTKTRTTGTKRSKPYVRMRKTPAVHLKLRTTSNVWVNPETVSEMLKMSHPICSQEISRILERRAVVVLERCILPSPSAALTIGETKDETPVEQSEQRVSPVPSDQTEKNNEESIRSAEHTEKHSLVDDEQAKIITLEECRKRLKAELERYITLLGKTVMEKTEATARRQCLLINEAANVNFLSKQNKVSPRGKKVILETVPYYVVKQPHKTYSRTKKTPADPLQSNSCTPSDARVNPAEAAPVKDSLGKPKKVIKIVEHCQTFRKKVLSETEHNYAVTLPHLQLCINYAVKQPHKTYTRTRKTPAVPLQLITTSPTSLNPEAGSEKPKTVEQKADDYPIYHAKPCSDEISRILESRAVVVLDEDDVGVTPEKSNMDDQIKTEAADENEIVINFEAFHTNDPTKIEPKNVDEVEVDLSSEKVKVCDYIETEAVQENEIAIDFKTFPIKTDPAREIILNEAVYEHELCIPTDSVFLSETNEIIGNGEECLMKNAEPEEKFVARETSEQLKKELHSTTAEKRTTVESMPPSEDENEIEIINFEAENRKTVECISLSDDENEVEMNFEAVDLNGTIEIRPQNAETSKRRKAKETPQQLRKRLAAEERQKRRLYIKKHRRIARLQQERRWRQREKRRLQRESETPEEREKRLEAEREKKTTKGRVAMCGWRPKPNF